MVLVPETPDQPEGSLNLDRLAEPYYMFATAGLEVVLCSPDGGAPLVAAGQVPHSDVVRRFLADRTARDALSDTLALQEVHPEDFEAAFCVGIGSAMWSNGGDPTTRLVADFLAGGKAVAIIPSPVNLELHTSHDGSLIVGEPGQTPARAAEALIDILRGADKAGT